MNERVSLSAHELLAICESLPPGEMLPPRGIESCLSDRLAVCLKDIYDQRQIESMQASMLSVTRAARRALKKPELRKEWRIALVGANDPLAAIFRIARTYSMSATELKKMPLRELDEFLSSAVREQQPVQEIVALTEIYDEYETYIGDALTLSAARSYLRTQGAPRLLGMRKKRHLYFLHELDLHLEKFGYVRKDVRELRLTLSRSTSLHVRLMEQQLRKLEAKS